MAKKAADKIAAGLNDAIKHSKGQTTRRRTDKAMDAPIAEIVNTEPTPPAPETKATEEPAKVLQDDDPTPTAEDVPEDPLEARLYFAKKQEKFALAEEIQRQIDQRAEDASRGKK